MKLLHITRNQLNWVFFLMFPLISMAQSHVVQDSWQDYGQEIWAWDSISVKQGFHYRPGTDSTQHHLFIDKDGVNKDDSNFDNGSQHAKNAICYENVLDFPKQLDQSKLPYNISGSLSVDPAGSANYSYPLELPGSGGISPQVSFNYNSNGGAGILGLGWSISGMESITRGPYSWYYDGIGANYNGDLDDPFYYNGSRIIKKTGNSWKNEITDYSEYTSVIENGNLVGFGLRQKNGLYKEFGGADYIIQDQNGINQNYLLKRVVDQNGFTLEYIYRFEDNTVFLDEIHYGGNESGLAHNVKLKFFYKSRNDSRVMFSNGKRYENNLLLERVSCDFNGVFYRNWNIEYAKEYQSFSLLGSIEVETPAGKFNTIDFQYEKENCSFDHFEFEVPGDQTGFVPLTLDANGDGFDDMVIVYQNFGFDGMRRIWAFRLYINDQNNGFIPSTIFHFPKGGDCEECYYFQHDIDVGDFNGDGYDDVIFIKTEVWDGENPFATPYEDKRSHLHYINLYKGNSAGTFDTQFTLDLKDAEYHISSYKVTSGSPTSKYLMRKFFTTGDFNRNGSKDLIFTVRHKNGSAKTYFQDFLFHSTAHPSTIKEINSGWDGFVGKTNLQPQTSDVDGDGALDILSHNYLDEVTKRLEVQFSDSWKPQLVYQNYESTNVSNSKSFRGDYNGDGIMDEFHFNKWSTNSNDEELWPIYFGKGNGDFSKELELKAGDYQDFIPSNFAFLMEADDLKPVDFNGDGLSDLLVVSDPNINDKNLRVLLSTGSGFRYLEDEGIKGYVQNIPVRGIAPAYGNFSGNGTTIVALKEAGSRKIHFFSMGSKPTARKLTGIADGLKNVSTIKYVEYASNQPLDTDWGEEVLEDGFRVSKVKNPVVESIEIRNVFGDLKRKKYNYGNKYFNVRKGFLGIDYFKESIFHDQEQSEVFSVEIFKDFNPEYFMMADSVSLQRYPSLSGPGKTIRTDYSFHFDFNESNRSANVKLLSKTIYNAVSGVTEKMEIAKEDYDDSGNIHKSIVTTSLNGMTSTKESLYNNFVASSGSLIPNFATEVTINLQRFNEEPFSKTSKYTLNGNGKIWKKKEYYGDPKWETEHEYFYNSLGKRVKETRKPLGEGKRVMYHVVYSNDGRYVKEVFNEAGIRTSEVLDVDPRFNKATRVMDSYTGKVTQNEYDALGNLVHENYDGRIETNYSRSWNVGNGESGVVQAGRRMFMEETQTTGSGRRISWLDGQDRVLKQGQEVMDGDVKTWRFFASEFDPYGLWERNIEPYFEGESLNAAIYTRTKDILGRPLEDQNSNGNTLFDYNGSEITITTPEKTTVIQKGSEGRVIVSNDGTDEVKTNYYSHGGIKEVTVGEEVVESLGYETNGLRSYLYNVDADTTKYEYNGFGQVTTQEDKEGRTIEKTYDSRGRLTMEETDENNIQYYYYPTGHGFKDQVEKIVGTQRSVFFDSYDDEFRPLEVRYEYSDGSTFAFSYEYDPVFGRVVKKTYPNGVELDFEYDSFDGQLLSVSYNGVKLVSDIDKNGLGQVESYLLNSGENSTEKLFQAFYDDANHPSRFFAHGIQDYRMKFEKETGNLEWRKDYTHIVNGEPLTESFGYDKNRLSSWQVGTGPVSSMSYHSNGNVLTKPEVSAAAFQYHSEKKHALSKLTAVQPVAQSIRSEIGYNAHQAPQYISNNNDRIDYGYGVGDNRVWSREVRSNGDVTKRYYIDDFERTEYPSHSEDVIFVGLPGIGNVALIVDNGLRTRQYYTFKDHLGTITKVAEVVDDAWTVVQEQAFDPWGRRRDPTNWTIDNGVAGSLPNWLYRGYTGHEMLDPYGLIHMNGRLYDPLLSRMLSPDNFVQDPTNSQNFNRYSYVLNNPLKYTDPNGEEIVTAILIGAAVSVIMNGINNHQNDQAFFRGAGRAAVVGGVTGALSFGIGGAVMNSGLNGVALFGMQTLAHAHLGGMATGFMGGEYKNGFISGAIGSAAAGITSTALSDFSKPIQIGGMVAAGGVGGGLGSHFSGGTFWDGARNGLISSALNHAMHLGGGDKLSKKIEDKKYLRDFRKWMDDYWSGETVDDVATAIGVYSFTHKSLLYTKGAAWLRYGEAISPFSLKLLGGLGNVANGINVLNVYNNFKSGMYSSNNSVYSPLTGLGDTVFGIVGFTGLGTPISLLYHGVAKPYLESYFRLLDSSPSFKQTEWENATNPFFMSRPK